MSRIGRMPIGVPSGVEVHIDGSEVHVTGPRGELRRSLHPSMALERENGNLVVRRPSDSRQHRALHGLTRTLVSNMLVGVSRGFEKTLEMYGVGYRASRQANRLVLALGFSHPIDVTAPAQIEIGNIETFSPTQANDYLTTRFTIRGVDKETLGQFTADLRALRPPEPYKGKGLRFFGEKVRRKEGKAGKTAAKGKGAK